MSQDVVTAVDYSEEYPYDSASFRSGITTSVERTKVGLGVGGDLAYFVSRHTGIGVSARFSGGTVELPAMDGGVIESRIGGFEIGAGLRLRF
jgi:hypothetical protein